MMKVFLYILTFISRSKRLTQSVLVYHQCLNWTGKIKSFEFYECGEWAWALK